MATSTDLISNVYIPVLTVVFSFLGGLGSGVLVYWLNNKNHRYSKLYGPLKFNLLMMKLMVKNKEEILDDIKEWASVEMRIDMMEKHLSPLTLRWIKHSDNIKVLFEENAGLIKKEDFNLMSDFMDGYVKREITEQGKNLLAVNENRTTKMLDAIKKFQDKLI